MNGPSASAKSAPPTPARATAPCCSGAAGRRPTEPRRPRSTPVATPTTVSGDSGVDRRWTQSPEVGHKASTSAGKPARARCRARRSPHHRPDLSDDDVIEAAVVNLAGKIVDRHSMARNGGTGRRRRCCPCHPRPPRRCTDRCSASAATPGIVDDHGVVLTAHVQWNNEPLAAVDGRWHVPCYVLTAPIRSPGRVHRVGWQDREPVAGASGRRRGCRYRDRRRLAVAISSPRARSLSSWTTRALSANAVVAAASRQSCRHHYWPNG
jgi:hypothetical protein